MTAIARPLESTEISELVEPWYSDFADSLSMETLIGTMLAADFLEILPLLDLTCAILASKIKDKTSEEILDTFGLQNDFAQEEKNQFMNENAWCREKLERMDDEHQAWKW